jgi:hypothetical protein
VDFWEFVARSEWPIVVGGTIWLLRRSFQEMLGRINPTKLDAFGFKAEFERTLDKVEQLTAPADQQKSPIMAFDSKPADTPELIQASPEAVILESWRQLENAARRKLPPPANKIIFPVHPTRLADYLNFTEDEIAAFQSLRKLRNQIAHSDTPVSRDDAMRFKEVTERLLERVRRAQPPESSAPPSS